MSPLDLFLLVVLGAIWGASFLFIRIGAPALGPVPLVELRLVLAAAALSGSPRCGETRCSAPIAGGSSSFRAP